MKQFNRKFGKEGEEIAAKLLSTKGYKILERNYYTKFGELDIIALKNNILIFIEVKLKHGEDFGAPEEMIGKNKLARVQRMAELYLMKNPQLASEYPSCQIDAVCIVTGGDGETKRINHYENIGF